MKSIIYLHITYNTESILILRYFHNRNDTISWIRRIERYNKIQEDYWNRIAENVPSYKKEAMDILLQELLSKFDMIRSKKYISRNIMTAIAYLNAGIVHKKRDMMFAMECYYKCIDLLEDDKLTTEGIIPAISVRNELVKLDLIVTPIIGIKEIQEDWYARNILKKLHISTLYSLAKICRNLIDKHNPACTRKNIQSKQLKIYGDWAIIVTKISYHFIDEKEFPQARYHLAVSSYILKNYLKTLKAKGTMKTRESIAAEYEHYDKTVAKVAKYWVRYGITLLLSSRIRLTITKDERNKKDQDSKLMIAFNEMYKHFRTETMEDPTFRGFVSKLRSISNKITDKYLLDFNSAKIVFRTVRKSVKQVKKYYTFENYPLDYAYNALYFSEAYNHLAFFECPDKRVKMHERRVEILQEVINRLCPRDHQIVCRRIWLNLAEAYLAMVNLLEIRIVTSKEKELIPKFENLAKSSIKYYQSYMNSLEMSKSPNRVESFADNVLIIALNAYFNLGALYNKINAITFDIHQKIVYVQNSIDAYTFIVNYYNDHPEKKIELKKYKLLKLSKKWIKTLSSTLEKIIKKHEVVV
ncbi:KIF1-binding protein like protein [Cyphomyrmex costatus]|uniref:KIF-binding protein n=1 Tax=Cyphomyrmex costatus TaxID=456900 RepID=A0A195CQ96_9HYME|nr:KIF1-binding protein like protein [Cyphomyrmex costatus]